jgi:lysophospholipase L1-like esterase
MPLPNEIRAAGIAFGVIVALIVVYDAFKIVRALRASAAPSMQLDAYSSAPARPASRLLVIGDSTAVGTGAETPQQSVAGRLSADVDVDDLSVENRAADGALTQELTAQLDAASGTNYDAVLVQVGGNDILRFTKLTSLRASTDKVLAQTRDLSQRVVLIVPGLVGDAPAIPWPLSYLLNHRARAVRSLYREVAERHSVHFIDLTRLPAGDGAAGQNERQRYAHDGLHPSGEGYARWYDALREQSPVLRWLQNPHPQYSSIRYTTATPVASIEL